MSLWFGSDNEAPAHPDVMRALAKVNAGACPAYGEVGVAREDAHTAEALGHIRKHFGDDVEAYFVYNGTAANVLSLRAVTRTWNAVICADVAHANRHECAAPENYCGTKLLAVPTTDGKLSPEAIRPHLHGTGDEHVAQPGAVSITQATEFGAVYSRAEVAAVAETAHANGMRLHMDGARLANAAAALGASLREITRDAGVDVLSFGATKNGGMFGDAVVFLDPSLARDFRYIRKQGMQLHSKMRFIAAQFSALLRGDLWRANAARANGMAARLADGLRGLPGVRLAQEPQTNAVFAELPVERLDELSKRARFHRWGDGSGLVRLMTSYDTADTDVDSFVENVRQVLDYAP